jgi:hypothetical protein
MNANSRKSFSTYLTEKEIKHGKVEKENYSLRHDGKIPLYFKSLSFFINFILVPFPCKNDGKVAKLISSFVYFKQSLMKES